MPDRAGATATGRRSRGMRRPASSSPSTSAPSSSSSSSSLHPSQDGSGRRSTPLPARAPRRRGWGPKAPPSPQSFATPPRCVLLPGACASRFGQTLWFRRPVLRHVEQPGYNPIRLKVYTSQGQVRYLKRLEQFDCLLIPCTLKAVYWCMFYRCVEQQLGFRFGYMKNYRGLVHHIHAVHGSICQPTFGDGAKAAGIAYDILTKAS